MLSIELLRDIKQYLDENYVAAATVINYDVDGYYGGVYESCSCLQNLNSLDDIKERLSRLDESFGEALVGIIDARGMTDADCYHRAQLNRSHFNKIKNDPHYRIQKETVFALALALELNLEEAEEFLGKAGFAFSSSSKADLIVEYCIEKKIYNVVEVNQILYTFDQKLLGAGLRA